WVWSQQGAIDMHRPEMWGYVQFTHGQPGAVKFVPDATGEARHLLHQVYYRQREFRKNQKRWAKSLEELGLGALTAGRVQTTDSLFEAATTVKTAGGPRHVHIRQDSLVWVD